jgi:hypothetical protein
LGVGRTSIDLAQGQLLGLLQPARLDVGGGDAGGIVDEQDVVTPGGHVGVDLRSQHGVNQHEQGEQLQQQEQVAAQPLEEAVDMGVVDALAPQESAGHGQRLALELEEVEQHQQQQGEQEAGRQRQGQVIAEAKALLKPAVGRVLPAEQVQYVFEAGTLAKAP